MGYFQSALSDSAEARQRPSYFKTSTSSVVFGTLQQQHCRRDKSSLIHRHRSEYAAAEPSTETIFCTHLHLHRQAYDKKMRSLIFTTSGQVAEAFLPEPEDITTTIGCETLDSRRVCNIAGGFLCVYFDDLFIAKGLPVNDLVSGRLYDGVLCGTVILQACNTVGDTIDLPMCITVNSWCLWIDRYRARIVSGVEL